MKLFVATGGGATADDYSRTVEGELVRLPVTCDAPGCDCSRAMTGLASAQDTTTFTVRELNIDKDMYRELLWATLERDGWVTEDKAEDSEWVDTLLVVHIDLASSFDPGTPLRLDGDMMFERR